MQVYGDTTCCLRFKKAFWVWYHLTEKCLNQYMSHINVLIAFFGSHLIKKNISYQCHTHCIQMDSLYKQSTSLHVTLPLNCYPLIRYGNNKRPNREIRHGQIGWHR